MYVGLELPCIMHVPHAICGYTPHTFHIRINSLCGIGFTMSLFVGSLAFVAGSDYVGMDRMGILTGSILAALIGYGVTLFFSRKQAVA